MSIWKLLMQRICLMVLLALCFLARSDAQSIDQLNQQIPTSTGLEKVSLLIELMGLQQRASNSEAIRSGNEALQLLANQPNDHLELQVRTILSWCESRTGNSDSGLRHALRANAIANQSNDAKGMAEANYHIALAVWYQGKSLEAVYVCEQACQAYRNLDDKSGLSEALSLLGAIHRSRSSYHESLKCHRESLAICEQLSDSSGVARSQNNIGLIYWEIGELENALNLLETAISYYRDSGKRAQLASILSNLGLILIELDRPDDALTYLNEGIEHGSLVPKHRINAKLISNVGFAYEAKDDHATALRYYRQALALRTGMQDSWGCARTLGCIGNIQAVSNQHEAAIESLSLGLGYACACDAREEQADIAKLLADSYHAKGDHKNALAALERHFKIKNELNTAKTMKQIAELESDSKLAEQKSRVALLEKAQLQQTLKLDRQRNRLWFLISLVILSATASVVVIQSRAVRAKKQSYVDLQSTLANLQESEERYRCIFEDSVVPKFLFDPNEDTILDLNSVGMAMYQRFSGHTQTVAASVLNSPITSLSSLWLSELYSLVDPDKKFQIWNWTTQANEICEFELRSAPVWVNGRQCLLAFVQDVTERRRSDEERIRLEKADSLAAMAGGIAHDFRNALTAILGFVSVARLKVAKDSEADQFLERAEDGGEQANWLTSQLITYSKGGSPEPRLHNLENLLVDAVNLANVGSRAKLEMEIEQAQLDILVDEGQFKQVVSNLVINANQAMEDCGELSVRAEKFIATDALSPVAASGNYICIMIKDTGPGIPVGIRNKVFDPYFTTKDNGTGLGLSTAFAIVQQHNGHMDIQCDDGEGTTFSIYLPIADGSCV